MVCKKGDSNPRTRTPGGQTWGEIGKFEKHWLFGIPTHDLGPRGVGPGEVIGKFEKHRLFGIPTHDLGPPGAGPGEEIGDFENTDLSGLEPLTVQTWVHASRHRKLPHRNVGSQGLFRIVTNLLMTQKILTL